MTWFWCYQIVKAFIFFASFLVSVFAFFLDCSIDSWKRDNYQKAKKTNVKKIKMLSKETKRDNFRYCKVGRAITILRAIKICPILIPQYSWN